MKQLSSKLVIVSAISAAISLSATAGDNNFVFTYDYEGATIEYFGVQRNVGLDAAMLLKDPSLVGSEIIGISVDIPTKPGCSCDPEASAWLTSELKVDGEFNSPDIQEVKGTIKNYGTDETPELRLDLTFDTPYTVTEDGVFVGYSVVVTSCNVPGSGWTAKYPIATVTNIDRPQSFMIHTTQGSSTLPQKYPDWVDLGVEKHQALAMRVIMKGKTLDVAASLEPQQTLYVASGEAGNVYAYLNNLGSTPISSFEYSYTLEGNGIDPQTITNEIILDSPVAGQIGAYTTVDLPIESPETVGMYKVKLVVSKVNGIVNEYKGHDYLDIEVLPFVPKHIPLLEDYTGFWCGYCPALYVTSKQLHDKYGDDFISIAYHVLDGIQGVSTSDMPSSTYGLPKAYIEDRESEINWPNIESTWNRLRRELAPADIDLKLSWENSDKKNLRVYSKVKFVKDNTDSNFKLAFALVEDGMSDSKWAQANDYLHDHYEGPYWDLFCGTSYLITGLVYDDVVVVFPNPQGINGSLPSSIEAEKEYSFTTVLDLDDATCKYTSGRDYGQYIIKNSDKLRVVALIIDGETGNVVNCATTDYSEFAPVGPLDGIEDMTTDNSDIVSVSYLTLDGTVLTEMPSTGIVIVVSNLSDGRILTEKRVISNR